MSQFNQQFKRNQINSQNRFSNLHRGAAYVLFASTVAVIYMIWHYFSFGHWIIDSLMQSFMKDIRTPWLDAFFRALTATGETLPVIIVTAMLVMVLILLKKHVEATMVAIYMLGIWRFNELLKVLLHRPRPDVSLHLVDIGHYNQANSFSMPSGHSMNLMALVLLIVYLLWFFSNNRKLNIGSGIVLVLYGLLTGISRVYLNVHYISDVLTGWSISVAWAAAAIILHGKLCLRRNRYNI